MININTLNPIVNTILKAAPFRYLSSNDDEVVVIPDYSAIVLEKDPKTVVQVLENNFIEHLKIPFFLQHPDVFYNSQKLFKNIFNIEPDVKIYDYQSSHKVSIFLFFNKILIEKARKREDIIIELDERKLSKSIDWHRKILSEERKLGIDIENVWIEKDKLFLKLPQGVYPVVGGLNSLHSGFRSPNFNLVFGTEYESSFDDTRLYQTKNHPQNIDYPIDTFRPIVNDSIDDYFLEKGMDGLSLYSIDRFDLKYDMKHKNAYLFGGTKGYYDLAIEKATKDFVHTTFQLLLAINRSKYLKINPSQFSAAMPHFYEIDRTPESVKSWDRPKKYVLDKLYAHSEMFAKKISEQPTCKHFIDYFLKDSIINFEALKKDPAKEILKAFKKQPQIPLLINKNEEIFSSFITEGKPNKNYDNFFNGKDGQVEAKNKVLPYLR